MIVRGRWLLRPGRPPIENAALVVDKGRLVEVGPWPRVRAHVADQETIDPGHAILIPGLVNAHTHLALGDLRGQLPEPKRFTGWLGSIMKHVRAGQATTQATQATTQAAQATTQATQATTQATQAATQATTQATQATQATTQAAVSRGVAESLAAGVTTLAEISYDGTGAAALAESPLWSVMFVELFGHSRSSVNSQMAAALRRLDALPVGERFRAGLSPHAPYSAGVEAYLAAAREADRRGLPLTTHLHETPAEIELYLTGRGEFSQWPPLRAMLAAARFKPPGKRPIQVLDEAGFFDRPRLVAHGNYLDRADLDVLRRSGSTVVYCPRSHDYFGHAEHPYRRLAAAGVPVALGTDSLASSPSLSILEEMRFLHRRDGRTPPEELLEMATVGGAEALGRGDSVGRLTEGQQADLVALRPAERPGRGDPYESLLSAEARVVGVWICGRRVAGDAGRAGQTGRE